MTPPFTDLDTSSVDPDRAAIFAVEFFVWWEEAGRTFYRHDDDGLKAFAHDAVQVLGGWRHARRVLRSLDATTKILIEAKVVL